MARRPKYDPRDYEPRAVARCEQSGDKIIFPNAADARRAAEQVYYDYGRDVDAYQDPNCGHWHLTSGARD